MTEKPPESRRIDPFRREPPTIDGKARDVTRAAASEPAKRPAPAPTAPAPAVPGRFGAAADKAGSSVPPPTFPQASAPQASVPQAFARKGVDAKLAGTGSPGSKAVDVKALPASARPAVAAPASETDPAKPSGPAKAASPAAASASVPPLGKPSTPTVSSAPPEATPVGTPFTSSGRRTGAGTILSGAVLSGAVLGGIVGAALAVGAEHYLVPQTSGRTEARLAALEQRAGGPPVDTGLQGRVATLETAQKAAAAAPRPAPPPVDPALRQDLDGLGSRLAALEDGTRQGGAARETNAAAIDDTRKQVAAIRTGLDDQTKQAGAAAQTGAAALAEITSRLTALQGQSAQQAQSGASAVQAMQGRLADDEKRLAALDGAFAKYGPEVAQAGLRVVVAGRLAEAMRAGTPLGSTVATLGRLGAPAPVIAALNPYVTAAPPSLAALEREFKPLGDRTLDAARGPASSLGDRLLRMADRIVTVRKVGEAEGSDVSDIVGQIETALARGDAGAAAKSWDALPDAVKPISSDWAARLKSRAAAGEAANRIQSDALSSIDASLR